jgi:hypothetical protein
LDLGAIAEAVAAFEAQSTGVPPSEPPADNSPAGSGQEDADAGRPEAAISRQALFAALARFRLESSYAAGAESPDADIFSLAGFTGAGGIGLPLPGVASGDGVVLSGFSGLAEGVARL